MPVRVGTKGYEVGDFIIREGMPREYDATALKIINSNSSLSWVMSAGQPMLITYAGGIPSSVVPVLAANVGTMNALLMEAVTILPSQTISPVGMFHKGFGLVVNLSMMPTKDHLGTSIDGTSFGDRLNAWNATVIIEPPKQELQST